MSGMDHSSTFSKEPSISVQPTPLKVAFSYNAFARHVTERYLTDTFTPEYALHFDLDPFKPNVSVLELLGISQNRGEEPNVFAHLVHTPSLPRDLHRSPVPTVSLDIDSFWWTASRVRWSMLFDYVFVWHPSLVPLYRAAGHPKVFALPHAVDESLFQESPGWANRSFELGWVGAFNYAHYTMRRRIVETLAARFRMNDFASRYNKQETADIYRQSKIVVNISRSDFPQEANMRCYEAMAGGALLITGMPSELTEWGFREGEHFIGWRNEAEIPDLVEYYLRHEQKTTEIARAGRQLTMSDFTFQSCRDKMTSLFREHPKEFFAPARNWPDDDVHLVYLEYYYRYQLFEAAFAEFRALRSADAYRKGTPMLVKTLRHALKRRLM